jgi:dihydrofolate reductase
MKLILATSKNGAIGNNNQLLFKQSNDLQRFKKLTTDNVVIMGRKTFESLGSKPLPNRINIVISRNIANLEHLQLKHDNLFIVDTIAKAIDISEVYYPTKEIFVIGGAEIYKQTIPLCTKVYLTLIETVVEEFDSEIDLDLLFNDKFKQTVVGKGIADEKNEFDYVYFELDRI